MVLGVHLVTCEHTDSITKLSLAMRFVNHNTMSLFYMVTTGAEQWSIKDEKIIPSIRVCKTFPIEGTIVVF